MDEKNLIKKLSGEPISLIHETNIFELICSLSLTLYVLLVTKQQFSFKYFTSNVSHLQFFNIFIIR